MFQRTKIIFNNNYVGVIATVDDDGYPRATPLHMASDGDAVYWFSNDDKVHSKNIARDPRVSLSLFSPSGGKALQGLYIHGTAERLDVSERPRVRRILQQRLGFTIPVFATGSAYRLPIGTLNEEKSTGNCWYFYS